jgi:nicotinate-nucleotide pyrophosphorylase (carboxylating)
MGTRMIQSDIDRIIQAALAEDIGLGDRTSEALLTDDQRGSAMIVAKSPGVLCGIEIAERVFEAVDPSISFDPLLEDGVELAGDRDTVARIDGSLKSILIAERTALNFLQRLSGVASLTRRYVKAVSGTNAQVVDTRKTIPGLRMLDKYAVGVGGARNHRFGLFDGILIKDNHIAAVGSVAAAVGLAQQNAPHTLRIEVEAKTLEQVDEALAAGADVILLDNMDLAMLRDAVARVGGRALTEASGGVTLDTIKAIAETGIDLISVGAITHSATAIDISLDVEIGAA